MNQKNQAKTVFRRIRNAFLTCFGGVYCLAGIFIVVLYYCLPASDAAKTSWFPILLFDPFVWTVAIFFATPPALGAFMISLLFIFRDIYSKSHEKMTNDNPTSPHPSPLPKGEGTTH